MQIGWFKVVFIVASIYLATTTLHAHTILEHDTYIDTNTPESTSADSTLFRVYSNSDDLYNQIKRYILSPTSYKRRGVEWWNSPIFNHEFSSSNNIFEHPQPRGIASLYTSTSGYRVGGSLAWSSEVKSGWQLLSYVDFRTGRDMNIEGVFQNRVTPELTLLKSFDNHHHLTISARLPYDMRGLRTNATQECYELLGNNLYNPSWGYYNGEVRNSRVVRNFSPTIDLSYRVPITPSTSMRADINTEFGTRRLSRLGWYNSYNPTPNYYSKLPSNFLGSAVYDQAVDIWRQNDTDYTQVAWDRLEQINSSSVDGAAYYVVEDMVERVADVDISLLLCSELKEGLTATYGAFLNIYNHRNYKQMRDLLGAEYLLDIDQYSDDNVQVGNEMQNNLKNPNRKITNGDRFGYDYTHRRYHIGAYAGVEYRAKHLLTQADISIGEESIIRDGHYEKERFSSSGSYGESTKISIPTYSIALKSGYAIDNTQNLTLNLSLDKSAPISRYLFIADQNSNRTIDSPSAQRSLSIAANYTLYTPRVKFKAEGYAMWIYNMGQVWQGYDDNSSTYCDIVISGISTRSIGAELSCEWYITHNTKLSSSVAAGGFCYTSSPNVKLYNDVDMSLVASSNASSLKGCVVGDAPQLCATTSLRQYFNKGFMLNIDLFYMAYRYASPSIIRRTDRVLNLISSEEIRNETTLQEQLPNEFNTNISLLKNFQIKGKVRITVLIKVNNILGGNDIIYSAREANRIIDNSSLQQTTYQYSVGRTWYLSVKYRF